MIKARYIIKESTLYIRPVSVDKKLYSEVKEYDQEPMIVELKPLTIIEQSCNFYKTSYQHLKESTRIIADICHKPPIVIKPETGTYFFPSHGDRIPATHWFNLNLIQLYGRGQYNDSEVLFDDGTKIIAPISYNIFNTQYLHAVKLEYCLRTKAVKDKLIARREVNYAKETTNIYEVLAMYAMLEH